jgi:hypothetical protein
MPFIEIRNEKTRYEKEFEKFVIEQLHELRMLAHEILKFISPFPPSTVVGGRFQQSGDPMLPITPGNSPQFAITPTFSGAAFTTLASAASVVSSDPVNFPITLDPTDLTGLNMTAVIPITATPTGGSEAITVTWTYVNVDGSVATVVGTVTETGIVPASNVTGGSFAQTV